VYQYSNQQTRLSYLWQQCHKYNITVSINKVWIPNAGCDDGSTIMDFAVKDPLLRHNASKLRSINCCRLYLQVMWPSDLLHDSKSAILDQGIIRGVRRAASPILTYPYQEKPSPRCITLWKEFIFCTFCLVRRDCNKQMIFKLATPVCIGTTSYHIYNDYEEIISSIQYCSTLQEKFSALPTKFRDIIGNIHLPPDDGRALLDAIRDDNTNVLLASDGSYLQHANLGSHAYKISYNKSASSSIFGSAMSPHSD
jgi:hypothetical protein